MRKVCKFEFDSIIDERLIEVQMDSAITAVRGVFGESRVKIEAVYLLSGHKGLIDISNEVGRHLAIVFTEFVMERIGRGLFTLEPEIIENNRRTFMTTEKQSSHQKAFVYCLRCHRTSPVALVARCNYCGSYAVKLRKQKKRRNKS